MKRILFMVGTTFLRGLLLPQGRPASFGSVAPPHQARLNVPYLKKIARRYALLAGAAYIILLFLALGTVMALQAAAQSYDLFGVFVPGAVFYTGITLALLSLFALGACFWAAKRPLENPELVFIENEPENSAAYPRSGSELDLMRVVEPILSGLIAGWSRGRKSALEREAAARASEEPGIREARAV